MCILGLASGVVGIINLLQSILHVSIKCSDFIYANYTEG
jgi:hypothetical protein